MDIKVTIKGDQTTLYLSGEIDVTASESLKKTLEKILEEDSVKELNLDFENVNFLGSCGIGRLLLFYRKFDKRGGKVRLLNLNKEILEIFLALRLENLFHIIDD